MLIPFLRTHLKERGGAPRARCLSYSSIVSLFCHYFFHGGFQCVAPLISVHFSVLFICHHRYVSMVPPVLAFSLGNVFGPPDPLERSFASLSIPKQ